MKLEDLSQEQRDKLIKAELARMSQVHPNVTPVFLISSLNHKTDVPKNNIMFVDKSMKMAQLNEQLKKKHPEFTFRYVFGKDHQNQIINQDISLKQKRKKKQELQGLDQQQKIIAFDQKILEKEVGQLHKRYKDQNGLLVIVLTNTPMVRKKAKTYLLEIFFLMIALIFAGGYIYLSFANAAQEQKQATL